jgi:hypothetical protein
MKAESDIEAGICGFHTTARAESEDHQHVVLDIETDCEKIEKLSWYTSCFFWIDGGLAEASTV